MAIAWLYRDEYAKAGFVMLPNEEDGGARTAYHAVGNTVAVSLASLCPFLLGLNGVLYAVVAVAAGAAYLVCAVRFARHLTARRARQLFLASIIYLPILLLAMVCDKLN
jgi:protoheme IX farnesyltransferase